MLNLVKDHENISMNPLNVDYIDNRIFREKSARN